MSESIESKCAHVPDLEEAERTAEPHHRDMVWVAGGVFLMGSDHHYPEERPAHRVRVDGFWMDRTSVTNREFRRFVEATSYVTFAELPPAPRDYPGALPESRFAGIHAPAGAGSGGMGRNPFASCGSRSRNRNGEQLVVVRDSMERQEHDLS